MDAARQLAREWAALAAGDAKRLARVTACAVHSLYPDAVGSGGTARRSDVGKAATRLRSVERARWIDVLRAAEHYRESSPDPAYVPALEVWIGASGAGKWLQEAAALSEGDAPASSGVSGAVRGFEAAKARRDREEDEANFERYLRQVEGDLRRGDPPDVEAIRRLMAICGRLGREIPGAVARALSRGSDGPHRSNGWQAIVPDMGVRE